jgi:hypothetical protein
MGGDEFDKGYPPIKKGFNPRPRMGGDKAPFAAIRNGARFQSTPPHGGRPGSTGGKRLHPRFQSTPRMGGTDWIDMGAYLTGVSIHAPAWGATILTCHRAPDRGGFNPRPRMGGDPFFHLVFTSQVVFQSTPPHGGRPNNMDANTMLTPFQSTPRMGGDMETHEVKLTFVEFQSTPPHGGRPCLIDDVRRIVVCFNPRPRMGGDIRMFRHKFIVRGFNPRPRMGGDSSPKQNTA